MTTESQREYPVGPNQINAQQHFWEAFGHTETEISAGYIVRMLQEGGEWRPFTLEEIKDFCQRSGHRNFSFNGLIKPVTERLFDGTTIQVGGGFVIRRPDGKYEVTEEFVRRVYESSPRESSNL